MGSEMCIRDRMKGDFVEMVESPIRIDVIGGFYTSENTKIYSVFLWIQPVSLSILN